MSAEQEKLAAARAAAEFVEEGMTVGLGTGSTVAFLLPALGPVTAVSGVRGRGDHVHLVLSHEGGATSSMELSLTMPVAARHQAVELWDARGRHVRPDDERDVAAAYAQALTELVGAIRDGRTTHRCDVRFGRDVVEVLARCEAALDVREIPAHRAFTFRLKMN